MIPETGRQINELMDDLPGLEFKEVTPLVLQGALTIDLCRPIFAVNHVRSPV